jgi:hypothetical protein
MTIEVALNDGGAHVFVEVPFPQCALSTRWGPSGSTRYGRRQLESGRCRYKRNLHKTDRCEDKLGRRPLDPIRTSLVSRKRPDRQERG